MIPHFLSAMGVLADVEEFLLPISLYVLSLLLPELSNVIWGGININTTQFLDIC